MEEIGSLLSCAFPVAALFLLLFFISGLRVLQEYERAIVFRLGRYTRIAGPGLYWLFPVLERQRKVDIRTVTVAVERQETITKDSVTVKIDAVVWYRIVNPAKAIISVADYRYAIHQVALTSLRNIIGQHVLDEVLKERDIINRTLQNMVDASTEPWASKSKQLK